MLHFALLYRLQKGLFHHGIGSRNFHTLDILNGKGKNRSLNILQETYRHMNGTFLPLDNGTGPSSLIILHIIFFNHGLPGTILQKLRVLDICVLCRVFRFCCIHTAVFCAARLTCCRGDAFIMEQILIITVRERILPNKYLLIGINHFLRGSFP